MTAHPDLQCLLADDAPPSRAGQRREVLAHVARCPDCRSALAAADPWRLFALLGAESIPESVLQRVSDGVARTLEAQAPRPAAGRLVGWLGVAASLLLAVLLSTYLGPRDERPRWAVARPSGAVEGVAPEALFEVLESPGTAEVVRIDLGGPELVMIFDKALRDL